MAVSTTETIVILGFLFVLLYSYRMYVLQTRIASLSRMEAKIDVLLAQAGVTFEPYENVSPLIVEQIKKGYRHQASTLYRKSNNASREDAAAYVEKVGARAGALPGIGFW